MKQTFHVMVGERYCARIEKAAAYPFMNSTWNKFNKYANSKGYTERVEGQQYLGCMAWTNGTEIMELVDRT